MSVFLMIKCMFLHSTMPPCLVNSFQAFTWFQMFPDTWCYLNQMWMEEQHPKQVYEIVTRGRCLLRSLWLSCVAVMGEDQPITISLQLKSSSTTYFSFQVVVICLVLCLVFFLHHPLRFSLFPSLLLRGGKLGMCCLRPSIFFKCLIFMYLMSSLHQFPSSNKLKTDHHSK